MLLKRTLSWPRVRLRWLLAVLAGCVLLGSLAVLGILGTPDRAESRGRGRADGYWEAVDRGWSYLHQHRPDLALEAVAHVRDEGPGAGEAMTVAGVALYELGQINGARLALERAIKLQPNQFAAVKALADLYLRLGDGPRGAELLDQAARLNPRDFPVWLTLGRVRHDLGEPAEAARAYEQALKLHPDDREARALLIADLLAGNQAERATPWLAEALREEPASARLLGLAARQARDLGRADEALELADRALEREPNNLNALLVRGRLRLARGQVRDAQADLERAVADHPNDVAALQLLAEVQARLGLDQQAEQTVQRRRRVQERTMLMDQFTRQIAEHPEDPEPRWRMGRLAAEGGSTLLADRCFRAALALDPRYQPALAALAALQQQQRAPGASSSTPDRSPADGPRPGPP